MIKQQKINASLYKLGILSLITAIIWILMGIYSAINKQNTIQVEKKVLAPFSAKIDEKELENLLQRNY